MSKVTSKLQVTIPKRLAEQYAIEPGDQIQWEPAQDVIRLLPTERRPAAPDASERLRLFDNATRRQRVRQARGRRAKESSHRAWRREDLYQRAHSR